MKGERNVDLDGLNAVSWHALQHAYGSATDLPDLIRDLISSSKEVRDQAWYQLHGNIWHQGTVYEATAHAVPFLIRLLELPEIEDKHKILIFLALVFVGRSYRDVHQHLQTSSTFVSELGFADKLKAELSWVEATKQAVLKGEKIYFKLLQTEKAGVRITAAYLLGVITSGDLDSLEAIERVAEQ